MRFRALGVHISHLEIVLAACVGWSNSAPRTSSRVVSHLASDLVPGLPPFCNPIFQIFDFQRSTNWAKAGDQLPGGTDHEETLGVHPEGGNPSGGHPGWHPCGDTPRGDTPSGDTLARTLPGGTPLQGTRPIVGNPSGANENLCQK